MIPSSELIESESTIVLTRRESLRLLELIENPPPMNDKLKKLMADYEKGGQMIAILPLAGGYWPIENSE